jgi:hypothetical protein
MASMSEREIRRFLMQGTFTGKLATIKKDGSSHIVPIWFVFFRFATKIAQRYMGKDDAENYGRRNSIEGEVLVRIKAKRIIAEKDIAGWD